LTSPVEAARQYLEAGWAVVPVEPGTKSPKAKDWPVRAAAGEYQPEDFEGKNVGVVLGTISQGLVDIDLDSALALRLAPAFLPATLTFGRASKPDSHWLYYAPGIRSAMHWFRAGDDPKERDLIEIRSTNVSNDECGHQSVFPGSTHESGEAVEWTDDEHTEPKTVDAGELSWCVCRLTVACILLRDWHEGSGRRTKALCVSSGLLGQGWTVAEVRELFEAVQEAAGDSQSARRDFGHQVETTIEAFEAGRETLGYGSLVVEGIYDAAQLKELERHARTPEARLREVKLAMTGAGANARARLLAEARAVDGITSAADIVAGFGKEDGQTTDRARREGDREASGAGVATPADEGGERAAASGGGHPFEARGVVADLDVEPAPLTYLWGPFAPGKVSAIASFANGGKSPFAELFALHAVAGRDFFGQRMRQCRAAYLDFEGGRLSLVRLRRLARGMGFDKPPEALRFLHMSDAIDEAWIADLDSYVQTHELGLVVIDTYGAAMAADLDHNSAQFAHWLKQLGRLSHTLDCVVLVLLHEKKREQGKRKGSDLEMISGHNAAPGALQGVVSLYRPDEDDKTLITVQCARAPEEAFETFNIRWEDVPCPEASTPGEKLKTGGPKWGLRAVVTEKTTEQEKEEQTFAAIQLRALEILTRERPDGASMSKSELCGRLRAAAQVAKDAIDSLVRTGGLLGNYKPGETRAGQRQEVWLPGKKNSAIG
jgi:hypothetical protein